MATQPKPIVADDFESIRAEALARIPVHTPEWTHFDESDPGVTLLELFAFMTESLLYRANRIPERNRLKFLELLNVGLVPAAPATGFVVFDASKAAARADRQDRGLQLAAGNVPFLTETPITILPVEPRVLYKKAVTLDAEMAEDYEEAYASFRSTPGTELRFYETRPFPAPEAGKRLPAFDIDLEAELDRSLWIALLAPKGTAPAATRSAVGGLTLSVGVIPSLEDGAVLSPFAETEAATASADVVWELFTGVDEDGAALDAPRYEPLNASSEVDVFREPGVVHVELPPAARLAPFAFTEPIEEGTGDTPPRIEEPAAAERVAVWLRMRFRSRHAGAELSWLGVNAARVVQAIPVAGELVGRGSGEPDQVLTLAHAPVLEDSLVVEVEERDGEWVRWTVEPDLLHAGPLDRVHTVDRASGELRFGTGLAGRRPPAGRRVRASYRYGGGVEGNVPIGAVNRPPARVAAGIKVTNPVPMEGGAAGETVAQAERRIPAHIRHRDRAVSAEDYRDIVERTPGVAFGRPPDILPLYHPDRAGTQAGVITVLVVPATDPLQPAAPEPDARFLRRVCAQLEPRRLVTSEVHVVGPCYVPVWASVGVQIRRGHPRDLVLQSVREALEDYLSPLVGGPEGGGWPLGRKVVARDLEATAVRVPGVEYVVGRLLLAGPERTEVDEVEIAGIELPRLIAVVVNDGPAESIEELLGGPGVRGTGSGTGTGAGGAGGADGTGGAAGEGGADGAAIEVVPVPVVPESC